MGTEDYLAACAICGFVMYSSEAHATIMFQDGQGGEVKDFCSTECYEEYKNQGGGKFMGELMGWNYIGKCIYCQTSMYEKDEQIRPYPFNPHCNCREKAICDKCGKECTEEFLTKQGVVLRHPAFMWKASGLCVNCQNEALKARG